MDSTYEKDPMVGFHGNVDGRFTRHYSPGIMIHHHSSWFIMIHHDSSFSTFRLLLQIERDWNHGLVPTAQERRFSHCIWRTLIIRRNSPWKTCSYQTHWPGTRTNFKHEACASRSSSVFVPILTNLNIADPWANLERSSEIRDSPPFHPWHAMALSDMVLL